MNIGAFIDIDGTLYRDSLMVEHFKKLVKYEVIDPLLWHEHVKHTRDIWLRRMGDYDDFMLELAEIYIKSLKGFNQRDLDFISTQVINLQGDRVYSYTRDMIHWHKKNGHKIFFISGSPDYLVSKMAARYGATEYRGSIYEVDEIGCFTGNVIPMWDSESKFTAISDIVEKHSIDLKKSYAYGDTNGDFSMLRRVGNPVAINPTRELLESIRSDEVLLETTTVIVERKDLVYKMKPNIEILTRDAATIPCFTQNIK
jgi:HAD superfamily hydrolase (TIGR01490 family)